MARNQSVVNLDPIERQKKRDDAIIPRLLKTRWFGGKPVMKTAEIGHYLFCGKQRSGKTVSMLWFAERLIAKNRKKGIQTRLYSNLCVGEPLMRSNLSSKIRSVVYDPKVIHIFMVDEIHGYFPKDTRDRDTLRMVDDLTADFSQLAKKNIYVLSTAQVYGRLNKSLREQCLYMVNCRRSKVTRAVLNEFIDGDDIMCDELGRWSGNPKRIYRHGLPKTQFDTHRMIVK